MSSLNSLQTRNLLGTGQIVKTGTDTPIAFRLRKVGTESATSVTVTTATNIVLVGSTTTDTFTFATYTTVSSLVAAINATGRWEAKILDCLSTQVTTSSNFVTGAVTAGTDGRGNTVWDVTNDTSVCLEIGACLSPFRDFNAPAGHRVVIKEIKYLVDMGTAAANSAQLYKRKNGVETLLMGELSVDNTATTVLGFTGGSYGFVGETDAEYFYRVKDAATLADSTGNYVRLLGVVE